MDLESAARELVDALRNGGLDRLAPEERAVAIKLSDEISKRGVRCRFDVMFPEDGPLSRHKYVKHMEFFRAGKDYSERCFMAGNRIGKSETGAYEFTAHLCGTYPHWWEGWEKNEPIESWACGTTNEKLYEIVQEKLFGGVRRGPSGKWGVLGTGMIPPDRIVHETVRFKQNVPGVIAECEIRYRDSLHERSKIELKAYSQGRQSFEGTAQDLIWNDEEPEDAGIYSEQMMRLGTKDGRMMLTFTPLRGHTEVVEAFLTQDMRPASILPAYTEF